LPLKIYGITVQGFLDMVHSKRLKVMLVIAIQLVVSVSLLSSTVHAAPTVITFENLTADTIVANQYQNLGVTFNSPTAVNYFSFGTGFAHSGVIGIEQCHPGAEFCATPIEMTFAAAEHRVKLWVGYSARLTTSRTVILSTFDSLGNNVGSATIILAANASPTPIQTPLEVSTSGDVFTAKVNFAPSDVMYNLAVDDVEFDAQSGLPAPLTCAISVDRTSGQAPLFVSFQGSASGGKAPYTFSWDLGDASSAQGESTSNSYEYPGSFVAVLTVTGADGASAVCSQQIMVSQPTPFAGWESAHCTGLNIGRQQLSVAFVPAKYQDDATGHLTIDQIIERANWIKGYYLQQSMCHVVITPTVIQGPDSGWFTLPRTKISYHSITPDAAEHLVEALTTWNDAVKLANPGGQFDAVVVIESQLWIRGAQNTGLRSRAIMDEPIAKSGQAQAVIALVVAALAPGLLPVLGPLYSQGVLQQGSVITSDQDSTETWAHELGHALFEFWDHYDESNFSIRGVTYPWDLMSNPGTVPPPPISIFEKVQQEWLQYSDIVWHDPTQGRSESYSLTPMGDLKYGAAVPRLGVWRSICDPFCHRRNVVDWYIFELRNVPDAVPLAPEQKSATVYASNPQLVIYAKREYHLGPPDLGYFFPDCGSVSGTLSPFVQLLVGDDFESCFDTWHGTLDGSLTVQNYLSPGQCMTDKDVDVQMCLQGDGRTLKLSDPVKSTTVVSVDMSVGSVGNWTVPGHVVTGKGDLTLPVNLNLFGSDGAHVGPNDQTGGYDVGIPGAAVGWAYSPFQWISIPDSLAVSFVIDASVAVENAKAAGLKNLDINATLTVLHYDAYGNMTIEQQPTLYKLSLDKPSITGNIASTISRSSILDLASRYWVPGTVFLAAFILLSVFLVSRSRRRRNLRQNDK